MHVKSVLFSLLHLLIHEIYRWTDSFIQQTWPGMVEATVVTHKTDMGPVLKVLSL